jgi:hypothetical protein
MVANPAGIIRRNTTDNIGDYLRQQQGFANQFNPSSATGSDTPEDEAESRNG